MNKKHFLTFQRSLQYYFQLFNSCSSWKEWKWGIYEKQSLLNANFSQKQLSLPPLADFFRISARCKLLIYSSASFRPIGEEIFNHLICHLGLFPEELVEIEWAGFRDCQEMLYRVQKHFYHFCCLLIGRQHSLERLDVIHQTTFYRLEISVSSLKCTGLCCTPGSTISSPSK